MRKHVIPLFLAVFIALGGLVAAVAQPPPPPDDIKIIDDSCKITLSHCVAIAFTPPPASPDPGNTVLEGCKRPYPMPSKGVPIDIGDVAIGYDKGDKVLIVQIETCKHNKIIDQTLLVEGVKPRSMSLTTDRRSQP